MIFRDISYYLLFGIYAMYFIIIFIYFKINSYV